MVKLGILNISYHIVIVYLGYQIIFIIALFNMFNTSDSLRGMVAMYLQHIYIHVIVLLQYLYTTMYDVIYSIS